MLGIVACGVCVCVCADFEVLGRLKIAVQGVLELEAWSREDLPRFSGVYV